MNVFDWLSALPLHDSAKPYPVIEVSFNKGSRKDFYRNNSHHILDKGDLIAVEGVGGFDVGEVSLTGELVKLQMKKYGVSENQEIKRVLRKATDEDIELHNKNKQREGELLTRSRAAARTLGLEMKLCEVELQSDGKKATFFYTADARVDFRELIKVYAGDFKVRVEMKQIGARQESGKVGGIGSCGRELCCSTWLTDFKSVNTTAARYQNLSINQTKLSGQCGRLKCCLNYELDTYMDALRVFPDSAEVLETAKGRATLQKRDIFKSLMWYSFSDSNKQYPLSITRVNEILRANKNGEKPEELQPVELEVSTPKAAVKVDVGFVNDVGQITLKALEKGNKKKQKGGGQKGDGKPQQQRGDRPQGNRPDNRGGQQAGGRPQGGNKPQQNEGRPQGGAPRPQQQGGNRPQQNAGGKPQQQGGAPRPQQQGGNKPQQNTEGRPQQQGGGNREQRPQGNRPQQGGSNRPPQNAGEKQQGNNPAQGGNNPRPPRPQGNRPQGPKPPQQGGGREQQPPQPQGPA
ncbi:MAG TPA: regulatory iron-sulfur-containing complex subunit RicT [Flavipsychrobacter sp.]